MLYTGGPIICGLYGNIKAKNVGYTLGISPV